MGDDEHESAPINERFSASDSDVTIRSSDGVLFKLHRKNIEMHSGAFPGTEIPFRDEIISLSESSEVLGLVFQYMYKQRQPELDHLTFHVLAAVAEAVEKYEVFSAMEVCKAHMKMSICHHPLSVLRYASRHDYLELCDRVAPSTLQFSFKEANKVLVDSTTFRAWVHYKNAQGTVQYVPPPSYHEQCELWTPFERIINELLLCCQKPRHFRFFEILYSGEQSTRLKSCSECNRCASRWLEQLLSNHKRNPPFSTFLDDEMGLSDD